MILAPSSLRAEEPCLESPDALGASGARKGVQKRDFLKRLRAEVSAWGGFYASDLLSSSYSYGGAVAFWPSEDFGVEASLVVTNFHLAVEKPLTDFFSGRVFNESLAFIVVGNFMWAPIHFKLRVSERAIAHGDFYVVLGAGDTIHDTVQGLTFDVGFGFKLFAGRWFAVRFDVRDYLVIQEAVAVQRVTNNIVGTLGVSLFFPQPRPMSPERR